MLTKCNIPSRRRVRDTVAFRGLDRSERAGEGDFTHQQGLDPGRFPHLGPARCDRVEELGGCEGLFVWNGHRVLARDGQLLWDGQSLCNVTDGAKQFAVINSGLVVWPDGLLVDLDRGSVTQLAAWTCNRGQASFTASRLTLSPRTLYATTTLRCGSSDVTTPWLWTYRSVRWDPESGWTGEEGEWTLPHESEGRCFIPPVRYSDTTHRYSVQPEVDCYRKGKPSHTGQPRNEEGFYCQVTRCMSYDQGADFYSCQMEAQVYWARQEAQPLDGLFRVGDVVSITGTPHGVLDVDRAIIRAINSTNNSLTFDPDTFHKGDAAGRLSADYDKESVLYLRWTEGDTTRRYKVENFTAKADQLVVAYLEESKLRVLDRSGTVIYSYTITQTNGVDRPLLELDCLTRTQAEFEICRPVPDLSFICHHDNRLWGVSNGDNCVYASALGDPCNFYLYDGLSTDSYTVAVGSQGPFTGICSHNGSVLCWKEQGVHKVLGTLPSNYQLATYQLAGVGRDSGKSLVSLDGRLYYLGRDGVYCYTGSFPSCISQSLGTEPLTKGVGGTDGKYYYLSVERAGHGPELLVYHPDTGLWWRREALAVGSFARGEEGLLALTDSQLRTLNAGPDPMDFEALMAPMAEAMEQVQYSQLTLRCKLEPGAWLQVDTRRDAGSWQQAAVLHGQGHRLKTLRLALGRCARLEVRFRGHGECQVLELSRQYRPRGRG